MKTSLVSPTPGKRQPRSKDQISTMSGAATVQQIYDLFMPLIPFPLVVHRDVIPSGSGSVLHAFTCGLMLPETTAALNCCSYIQI